jgi:hypothetical protein
MNLTLKKKKIYNNKKYNHLDEDQSNNRIPPNRSSSLVPGSLPIK